MSRVPNFDPVARVYRWAEYLALGPLLQRTRVQFLRELADRRHAHVLGDGDGRFLAALLDCNRELQATAVDTSARMLVLLRARCWRSANNAEARLRTVRASALDVVPAAETDLVVTHFFLDCLHQQDVEALARIIAGHCQPGTLWLVSDFQLPESVLLRPFAWVYIRLLYLAFRVLTGLQIQRLPDPRSALKSAGFVRKACHQKLGGVLYTEVWMLATSSRMERTAAHPQKAATSTRT